MKRQKYLRLDFQMNLKNISCFFIKEWFSQTYLPFSMILSHQYIQNTRNNFVEFRCINIEELSIEIFWNKTG